MASNTLESSRLEGISDLVDPTSLNKRRIDASAARSLDGYFHSNSGSRNGVLFIQS